MTMDAIPIPGKWEGSVICLGWVGNGVWGGDMSESWTAMVAEAKECVL